MSVWPLGTFTNMAAVVVGSLTGLWFGQLLSPELKTILFQAVGLGVILMGLGMGLKLPDTFLLVLIFGLILGGLLGQLLGLDAMSEGLGEWARTSLFLEEERFTEGLVTAFMVFCVGSLTIVGAIEEGVHGNRRLLLAKSLIDGMVSIAFASTFGMGVMFSIVPMLLFQGGITLLARSARGLFSEEVISLMSATGGVLIVAIGINLLEMASINVVNLMPALLVVVLLSWFRRRISFALRV